MLLKPPFLSLHHIVKLPFVSYRLVFALEKIGDIISKEVIRDNESLLAFLTLLASVA